MTSVKTPQDHKPKAGKVKAFQFTGTDGEIYELPAFAELMDASTMELGDFLDAVDDGDAAVALFSLRVLHKAEFPADAHQALRSLPLRAGLQVAAEWQAHGQDVALPE